MTRSDVCELCVSEKEYSARQYNNAQHNSRDYLEATLKECFPAYEMLMKLQRVNNGWITCDCEHRKLLIAGEINSWEWVQHIQTLGPFDIQIRLVWCEFLVWRRCNRFSPDFLPFLCYKCNFFF